MIHDAIDAAHDIFWALAAMIAVLSALGTVLFLLLAAGLAWAWRRLRPRPRPSWALTRRAAEAKARAYREAA